MDDKQKQPRQPLCMKLYWEHRAEISICVGTLYKGHHVITYNTSPATLSMSHSECCHQRKGNLVKSAVHTGNQMLKDY